MKNNLLHDVGVIRDEEVDAVLEIIVEI